MSLIKLQNIIKIYKTADIETQVLKGVNLTIEEGEFVCIMGVSGSGKTTLMNIIGCLDTPTSGKYFFKGKDISSLDDDTLSKIRNEHIGFVFQQFYLIQYLTAKENVLVPTLYSSKDVPEDRAIFLLEKVGMKDKINLKPSQLSGGQQQRVAIARALINDPELIIADEPTGALDRKTAFEIMDIFSSLNKEGKTIIMVTHDPEIAKYARRIIYIEDGNIRY
ncbi:ABC transporter ATP-binding protein [Venenivibrio stagnispumantis]|uniref:ABC transport system ATP-binding protein n=1 Tax=Venenivibrio stagnispumantis TaxID=407998 RepID=A0AA45WLW7_9AQUI|nr:ABC transporter ATP-binding protein [Venenivibrio stagnispumantis]SMP12308.1 putative ABC transport system ATP-binding protein [Venenivibrio stagnispumantis]